MRVQKTECSMRKERPIQDGVRLTKDEDARAKARGNLRYIDLSQMLFTT